MPKKFYTDRDIEDLYRNGVKSLQVNDDVVLTDLAYEKARRLDIQLNFEHADNPPAAPVRPYLADVKPRRTQGRSDSVSQTPASAQTGLEQRIRSAVSARLGNQVDAKLLDIIIHRVVKATGLK
jgi:hypothetical protein